MALEKSEDFLPFSKTLSPFSRLFQLWKNAGEISRLFQEFKTLHETCTSQQHATHGQKNLTPFMQSFLAMPKPSKRKQDSADSIDLSIQVHKEKNLVA